MKVNKTEQIGGDDMKRFIYQTTFRNLTLDEVREFVLEVENYIKAKCGLKGEVTSFTKMIVVEYRITFCYSFTENINSELSKIRERYNNGS